MKNKIQVNTAAEVISVFGALLISAPCLAQLLGGSKPSRLPIWSHMLWSFGMFLVGVYFNRHPVLGGRHHHIITDVVAYPSFYHFLPYTIAALSWAVGIKDKILTARAAPGSSYVRLLFKWVVGPAVLAAQVLILTKLSASAFSYKTNYLKAMGAVGILGSILFNVGSYLVINSGSRIDRDLWLLQTLGFFVWLINTILMFTNVDWYGVTAIILALFGDMALIAAVVVSNKSHSYDEIRDEIVMDDLPTSRPRSRVQQEEF